ncbi:unnamed protein product [Rhizophagus irregularis]|nr:unnamed protein product [Rhizophagus irregularis]
MREFSSYRFNCYNCPSVPLHNTTTFDIHVIYVITRSTHPTTIQPIRITLIFSFLVMSTQDSTRLYCSICKRRVKGFKNRSGLQRHETLKHMFYNTLPSHIQPVPDSELSHLKKAIIKELQKRLKNHYTAVGKQVFSVHCSEDAFVGEKAFDEIGKILDDENWGNVNMEKVN